MSSTCAWEKVRSASQSEGNSKRKARRGAPPWNSVLIAPIALADSNDRGRTSNTCTRALIFSPTIYTDVHVKASYYRRRQTTSALGRSHTSQPLVWVRGKLGQEGGGPSVGRHSAPMPAREPVRSPPLAISRAALAQYLSRRMLKIILLYKF